MYNLWTRSWLASPSGTAADYATVHYPRQRTSEPDVQLASPHSATLGLHPAPQNGKLYSIELILSCLQKLFWKRLAPLLMRLSDWSDGTLSTRLQNLVWRCAASAGKRVQQLSESCWWLSHGRRCGRRRRTWPGRLAMMTLRCFTTVPHQFPEPSILHRHRPKIGDWCF